MCMKMKTIVLSIFVGAFAAPAFASEDSAREGHGPQRMSAQKFHALLASDGGRSDGSPGERGCESEGRERREGRGLGEDCRGDRGGRSDAVSSGGAVPRLSAAEVRAKPEGAGYRNVERLELERGVYEARAVDSSGTRVKLRVDARDGRVLDIRERGDRRDGRSRD